MPRCFSISIQSDEAWREALRPFTAPAIWIAPENSSSFSVSVVLPASGWLMMAKVRRRRTCAVWAEMGSDIRQLSAALQQQVRDHRPVLRSLPAAGEGVGNADLGADEDVVDAQERDSQLQRVAVRVAVSPAGAGERVAQALVQQRADHGRGLGCVQIARQD